MLNTLGEQRLSSLAILNIEKNLIAAINFVSVISIFASLKYRRCYFFISYTVTAEGHAHDPGIAIMRMYKKRSIFCPGFIVQTFLAVN